MLTKKESILYLKKFWHDDSWLSWVVNVVLAFILVKFTHNIK